LSKIAAAAFIDVNAGGIQPHTSARKAAFVTVPYPADPGGFGAVNVEYVTDLYLYDPPVTVRVVPTPFVSTHPANQYVSPEINAVGVTFASFSPISDAIPTSEYRTLSAVAQSAPRYICGFMFPAPDDCHLISVASPRIRDFRGLSAKSFDGRGNYSMGVKEQIMFPEIDYDKIDALRGLDITITTSARTDEEGRALLAAFNFPFRT
jgi:hypothetical protein